MNGLAMKRLAVVDQGVDAPEPLGRGGGEALGRGGIGDVAPHRENVRVLGVGDTTRGRYDGVAELAVRRDQAGADPLRRTGDDSDLPAGNVHEGLLRW